MKEYKILYSKGKLINKTIAVLKGYLRRIFTIFELKNYDLVYIFLNVTPLGVVFLKKFIDEIQKKLFLI